MKTTTYGQKGGEGPTAGKTSRRYVVKLPDGRSVHKRTFGNYQNPVGYAYQHNGKWELAGIADAEDSKFGAAYTQCSADQS